MSMGRYLRVLLYLSAIILYSLFELGCSTQQVAQKKGEDETIWSDYSYKKDESGRLYQEQDTNGDGQNDLVRYYVEIPNPDDPQGGKALRVIERDLDVDHDGRYDTIRMYENTPENQLIVEMLDRDLDGKYDVTDFYEQGEFVRREYKRPKDKSAHEVRHYVDGKMVRIERDTTGDGSLDRWEFYTDGKLTQIGHDLNKDGKIDQWEGR